VTRHCDGNDENLVAYFNNTTGARLKERQPDSTLRPCDCGRVFDDVRRTVVYPHPPV
jgi:hypothetical protein